MAEKAISEEDLSLFLWQKAAFMDCESGGRTMADSLRLRLGYLEYAYWKEKSGGNSTLHVKQLMDSYLKSYGRAVDDSEGLDNFAAPVKVLTTGRKNESKEWRSQLTFESVMEMPEIKALMKEKEFEQKNVNITTVGSTVEQQSPPPNQPSTSGISIQQSHGAFKKHSVGNSFPYPNPSTLPSNISSASCSQLQCNTGRDGVQFNRIGGAGYPRLARSREAEGGFGGPRKKPRVDDCPRVSGKEEEIMEYDDEKQQPSAFITARDQHVINQRKKIGCGGAASAKTNKQVSGGAYGQAKKSLGTRRVPSGKFVPPVKRGQDDELCEEITRRVFRGSSSGGGNSRGGSDGEGLKLPPELEGNEKLKNVEPRMVEVIMNEIMDHGVPVQWDDIAGLQFAKTTIKEIVVWPMLRPDIFTGLRGPPKGILLFGPPGTGKTLIGKCIASQVEATFFSISASSLTSKWIGDGEKMMRALFAVARCFQPAVIFIDEIDSLLTQRSDSEHESSRRIKTEFLVQLDGATTDANDRLLVIGATNRPQELDEAARRRLVKRLYIPLPDEAARKHIITNLMKEQSSDLSEEELDAISKQSEGYSGSDMANLCREAAYGPVRVAAENIQHISADEMRPILHKDFEAAFQIIKPSVSDKDLGLYVEWNKQFGCGGR